MSIFILCMIVDWASKLVAFKVIFMPGVHFCRLAVPSSSGKVCCRLLCVLLAVEEEVDVTEAKLVLVEICYLFCTYVH